MFRALLFVNLLAFSLAVTAEQLRNLEAELPNAESLLQTEPGRLYSNLTAIKGELEQFDTYSQHHFWALYCKAAGQIELHDEVIDIVKHQLAESNGHLNAEHKVALLNCRAGAKQALGKLQQSKLDFNLAYEYAVSANSVAGQIKSLLGVGELHAYQMNFRQAKKDLMHAYKLTQQGDFPLLQHQVNQALGMLYGYKQEYDKAAEIFAQNKQHNLDNGFIQQASVSAFNLGVVYSKLKKWGQAEKYLLESKALAEQAGDIAGIAYAELRIVPTLIAAKKYQQAAVALELAENFFEQQSNQSKLAEINLYHAQLLMAQNIEDNVIRYLNKAYQIYVDIGLIDQQSAVLSNLVKVHRQLGNFDIALDYHEKFHAITLTIEKNKNESATKQMQTEFEHLIREGENKQLKKLLAAEQAKVKNQEDSMFWQVALLGVLFVLLTLVTMFVYRTLRHRREVKSLAMTDSLTGVPNRRSIMKRLKKSIAWAIRYDSPLTVAIFDIDELSQINALYGYDAGDDVLHDFAQQLQENIRLTDEFGRLSGEEFMLIMPNTTSDQSRVLLNRILPAIRSLELTVKGKRVIVTASAGVAEFDIKTETLMGLFKRTEAALNTAKLTGKDRFYVDGKDS
ncbi:diguanylate cyclase [Thalassotalea euphylliae]|uniref:tetratricopeptide repeat-containing diguanylate cyclase n=1 Tax=Thalassotalea euphylliae TaxID=1655234 RepID=UPI00362ED229